MDSFTIFAIDQNGNHFSEEYIAITNCDALECFKEEHSDARALFIVDGSPDFVEL